MNVQRNISAWRLRQDSNLLHLLQWATPCKGSALTIPPLSLYVVDTESLGTSQAQAHNY